MDFVWEVQVPGGWKPYGQQMCGNLNNMFESGLRRGVSAIDRRHVARMCEFQMGHGKVIIDLGLPAL